VNFICFVHADPMHAHNSLRQVLCFLAFIAALAAARLTAAAPVWSTDVAPYLWVPSLTVDTSVPELPPGDTQRFTNSLSGAFMIAGQIHRNAFGLFVDYAWLRIDSTSTDAGPAYSGVDLRTSLAHSTAALTWRVPTTGAWQVDLLGGARIWWLAGEQVFQSGVLPGFTRRNDRTWVDPTFGADVRYAFDDHWFALGRAMFGGLGSGSQAMTDALLAGGYQFNGWCNVLLGYRYLHDDFAHHGFALDLRAQGFLLGVNFHF
jgi:hypothetical protein